MKIMTFSVKLFVLVYQRLTEVKNHSENTNLKAALCLKTPFKCNLFQPTRHQHLMFNANQFMSLVYAYLLAQ